MDQLREVLKEVLQQELAPITGRLDKMEGRFDGLEGRFDGLESRFDGLEGRFDGLENRFNGLEHRFDGLKNRFGGMENQLSSIKDQLDRIELAQTEDVIGMLHLIDKKITNRSDRQEYQIDALNHRLLIVEADVRKLMQSSVG